MDHYIGKKVRASVMNKTISCRGTAISSKDHAVPDLCWKCRIQDRPKTRPLFHSPMSRQTLNTRFHLPVFSAEKINTSDTVLILIPVALVRINNQDLRY